MFPNTFEVIASQCEEVIPKNSAPSEIVMSLSMQKAKDVAKDIKEDALIIGADTIVSLEDEILLKPKDYEDAFSMLRRLSGKKHAVYTGFTVLDSKSNKFISDYESTYVVFKPLSDELIHKYLETGEAFDKAGAYGIQGIGCLLIKEILGDYLNVVGMPASKLYETLKNEFGFDLLRRNE